MARPNQPTISVALKIIATGIALPPDQVISQQLDVRLNKPVGYVERHSGICWRYLARNDVNQAELAVEVLRNALVAAALSPTNTDLLICASAIAAQTLPCSAIHTLKTAVMPAGVAEFGISSSCASFISALEVTIGLLGYEAYRRIAIVSAGIVSRGIDWDREESSLIFGDDAVYAIVEQGDGRDGIIASLIEMYSEGNELCGVRAGGTQRGPRSGMSDSGFLFHVRGKPLLHFASSLIEDYLSRLLQRSNLQPDGIGTVVPHQASHLPLEHIRKRPRMPESTLVDVYRLYGSQVAASILMALHEAVISGRFTADKPIVLTGTVAGLMLTGAVLLPWKSS